jgi:hypothetical protein
MVKIPGLSHDEEKVVEHFSRWIVFCLNIQRPDTVRNIQVACPQISDRRCDTLGSLSVRDW